MVRKQVVASASDLTRFVQIQQAVRTSDGQGGSTIVWTAVSGLAHVPAQIETWKGYQQFTAGQIFPNLLTKITVRYRKSAPIDSTMRVVYGTRIFLIRNVQPVHEANVTVELICEELQAQGSTH